jgi:hypothetical protein
MVAKIRGAGGMKGRIGGKGREDAGLYVFFVTFVETFCLFHAFFILQQDYYRFAGMALFFLP